MTAATKRAKAKPRNSNGSNGAAAGSPPAVRPPEEMVVRDPDPLDPPNRVPHHPYGDREVFVWNPRDGSDPIVLPHFSTVDVSQEFFCINYEKAPIVQNMEFMILAGVPMDIRLQVSRLGDKDPAEQNKLFSAWYAAVTRPPGAVVPGES